jgi:uncharacterized protein (DUF2062 family)
MKFAQRKRKSKRQKIRQWIWPQGGWWRTTQYVWSKVRRLSDTPHVIAVGFAAGAFASFTPLWGFHFVVALLLAWMLGGNLLASALGTIVGNPITFPFIVPAIYEVGVLVLGARGGNNVEQFDLWDGLLSGRLDAIWPTWKPMLVGGAIVGPVAGAICYVAVRMMVSAYQARRKGRLKPSNKRPRAGEGHQVEKKA